MSIYSPPIYMVTIADVPGVVAAHNFLTVLNPASSGKVHIALQGIVASYSGGTTTVASSLLTNRITAHSGGTSLVANQIAKFNTAAPDATTEVRHQGPSATLLAGDADLAIYPPVMSAGAGSSNLIAAPPAGASFVLAPGQGIVWRTEAGDVDQRWNITYVWMEAGL